MVLGRFNAMPFNRPYISSSLVVTLNGLSSFQVDLNVLADAAIHVNAFSDIKATQSVAFNVVGDVTGVSNIISSLLNAQGLEISIQDESTLVANILKAILLEAKVGSESRIAFKFAATLAEEFNQDSRQIEAFVEIYFDEADPVIVAGDIESFTLLEELKADTSSPVGDITANEFTLSIDNSLRRFTPTNKASDLHGKLVPGIKVKPYLSILTDGVKLHQDIGLGTFYTGDWDAPSNAVTCTVTSNDRLYTIINLPFKGIKIVKNTTYADLYARVFAAAKLLPADYRIDTQLAIPVKMAHVPAGTIGSALKHISEASGSYVYTSREDVIQAKLVDYTATRLILNEASKQIINHAAPTRYLETYSAVQIPYHTSAIESNVTIATLSEYTLVSGENIITDIRLSNSPVVRITKIEIQGAPDAKVKYYDSTSDTLTALCIINAGDETEAHISIYGEVCKYTSIGVVVQDESLIPYVGDRELKITNTLIQTKEHAEWYANRLAMITRSPCPTLSLGVRGNPFIMLTSIVDVTDERYGIVNQNIMITRSVLEYAGGLSGSLTGYILPQEVI